MTLSRFKLNLLTASLGLLLPASSLHVTAFAQATSATSRTAGASAATVAEAAKVLDLRALELPGNARPSADRQLGALTYDVPADPKTAFEFHRRQLTKDGWKELPGSMVETTYASGMFTKAGYTLSCSCSDNGQSGADAGSFVSLNNFGNVPLNTVPLVDGASKVFVNEASAIYVTDMSVGEATDAMQKLLKERGWEFYGRIDTSDDQKHLNVRQNAVQLSLMISVAPAQNNQTSIMLSSSLLSAELPAPDNATQLQFVGTMKRLTFSTPTDFNGVGEFYTKAFAKSGWKPTTEQPAVMEDDFGRPIAVHVFRNKADDIISIDMKHNEEGTDVEVTHQTAQEFKDTLEREREAAKQLVAEREANDRIAATERKKMEAEHEKLGAEFDALAGSLIADALSGKSGSAKGDKGKSGKASSKSSGDATTVTVPTGTTFDQSSGNVLKLSVKAGKGRDTAQFIAGHLKAAGWDADTDDLDKTSGNIEFSRDNARLTLTYVDTGFAPVTMMLIGVGMELEAAESDEPAEKK